MIKTQNDRLPYFIVEDYLDTAPVNLDAICRALGIENKEANLSMDVSGKIACDENGCVITVNALHSRRRRRFTLAHEIAHFVLHRSQIGDGVTDDELYRSGLSNTVERQANLYAAQILMPSKLVHNYWGTICKSAEDLSRLFDVSVQVAEIRIQELGLSKVD